MKTLNISTPTHGRVLVEDPAVPSLRSAAADPRSRGPGVLIGCHGYGQNAAMMYEDMKRIPGADKWRLVSVQALHRFYTRNDQGVIASWMTREDRDDAIADNIEYLNRVVAEVTGASGVVPEGNVPSGAMSKVTVPSGATPEVIITSRAASEVAVPSGAASEVAVTRDPHRPLGAGDLPVVFLGFSQGASMAARVAVRGRTRAAGLILIGGDIPPDVREEDFAYWPPVLLGCGDRDEWYASKVESDAAFLRERRVPHEVVRFSGGHEFNDSFREAAGAWLAARL